LVFDSKQIYGNPYALNQNFTFQHLFYFPKSIRVDMINQVGIKLGWDEDNNNTLEINDGDTPNVTNSVILNKYNIYFGYDKSN
jgi:hypothetical protein